MKRFLDKNFMLNTYSAIKLYHNYASDMPIADYHCHINPKEIYDDKHYDNIFQVWLSADHYKWRIMRSNGVPEEYITGVQSERDKFQKFAEALPRVIGNPMYHWCHLELQRYFGYDGVLCGETAQEVWDLTRMKLKESDMGVRGLIEKSNVAFIGTTDDPADDLKWHQKLQADSTMKTLVVPSFRPDKAINIEKPGFREYMEKLSSVSGIRIFNIDSLKKALSKRISYFDLLGCRASDHGLDRAVYSYGTEADANEAFCVVMAGGEITPEQAEIFKTHILKYCASEYATRNWAMQLHLNCLRNPNSKMYSRLGADCGFDIISPDNGIEKLAKFLDSLNQEDILPKTILYSLDNGDNGAYATMLGAFQDASIPGKMQHGSAWWFNDNKSGMREQLINLANLSILGNFIGMLTDSRSILSYTRHEYFRRILCDLIGQWIEDGEYPADYGYAGSLIKDICFNNAKRYFNLEVS